MQNYNNLILDELQGDTPRQKYEYLESIIKENSRAKGRIDLCKKQFEVLQNEPEVNSFTKGWINSILETLSTPI